MLSVINMGGGGGDGSAYPVSIAVTTAPRTAYKAGDALNLSGIVVKATYSDGSLVDVTNACTFSPANGATLTRTNTAVTVSWTWATLGNTYTTSLPITVAYPQSIGVTTAPTKTSYKPGDALNLSGIVVKATYSDGSLVDVTNACTFSPANGATLTKNNTSVTITWTNSGSTFTTTQALTIMVATGIRVRTAPTKTSYRAGEALNLNGMQVVADYPDNTYIDITSSATCSPANGTTIYENTNAVAISWTDPDTSDSFTASQAITVTRVLSSLTMSAPTKTEYKIGEALNLSGASVIAHYNSGATRNVTTSATFSPTNGTVFQTDGTVTITATYAENGTTKTATCTVTVKPNLEIVTFADGTDEQLAAMLDAHYAGTIDIHDHWTVGDERTITLSAMQATGVGETHVQQTVTMVLMNAGGKKLSDGVTDCAFVVGQKNMLANNGTREGGYMNSSNTNTGGWKNCARRTWCNSVYYNAIPSGFRALLKQFINKSGTGGGSSSGVEDTTDYCALPAEVEVFGSQTYSVAGEGTQFKYYETSANRIKKAGDSGSAGNWWERSPRSGNSAAFCNVSSGGSAGTNTAGAGHGLAPFGCI